jgi:hypothetical protein
MSLQTLNAIKAVGVFNTPSRTSSLAISNKQVCGHASYRLTIPLNTVALAFPPLPTPFDVARFLHLLQDALFRSRYVVPEPYSPSPRIHWSSVPSTSLR